MGFKLPPESDASEELEEVLSAAQRATALTRQLLTFARREAGTPRRIDISAAIRQFEKLMRRLLGSRQRLGLRQSAAAFGSWPPAAGV